jgi:hypothetical protein
MPSPSSGARTADRQRARRAAEPPIAQQQMSPAGMSRRGSSVFADHGLLLVRVSLGLAGRAGVRAVVQVRPVRHPRAVVVPALGRVLLRGPAHDRAVGQRGKLLGREAGRVGRAVVAGALTGVSDASSVSELVSVVLAFGTPCDSRSAAGCAADARPADIVSATMAISRPLRWRERLVTISAPKAWV